MSLQTPLSQVGLAVAPALHLFFTLSGICIRRDAQRGLHRGSDSLTSLSLSAKMREIAQFRLELLSPSTSNTSSPLCGRYYSPMSIVI